MKLVAISRRRRIAQVTAMVAGAGCLSAWFGLSMAGTKANAATPCGAATIPASTGIDIHVNTTNGCDDLSGSMLYPITGTVAVNTGGGLVSAPMVIEGLSAHKDYWGASVVSLLCSPPVSTLGLYSVDQASATFPSLPTVTGVVATFAANATCTYSITVAHAPTVSGSGSDKLNSAKVEMWLVSAGNVLTQAATVSVDPATVPSSTPTPSSPSPTPSSPSPSPSSPSPSPSSPSPTPSSPSPSPSSPSPTPSSPSPTPSSPTPTPTNGVQGITTTPTPDPGTSAPAGGVQGIISVPSTGGGAAGGASGLLGIAGVALLCAGGLLGRRPKRAPEA